MPSTGVAVDIVVPVHNALALTRNCVESVLADPQRPPSILWLVDDASDSTTGRFLRDTAERDASVSVLRNGHNLGFLRSCNRGIDAGSAPFVVLLNSDVIVTPGWLQRLLRCAASDERIASVNPLTNRASQIDLGMPPGANFVGVDAVLARRTPAYPDIVTGVGFCMLLRRRALDEVGLFDEAFGHGYCEESDLCMRLTTRGWRTVVSDDCYVYHRGSGSFRDRDARYLRNRALFDQRWSGEYTQQFREFRLRNPLARVRAEIAAPTVWDPIPRLWETARELRAARSPLQGARALVRGALELPHVRRPVPRPDHVRAFERPGALRVTYILHRTVVAGGVMSVIQLVNELVRLGVDARIATLFLDPAVRKWAPLLSEPMVFRSEKELLREFPHSDVVVATHWTTAGWAQALVAAGRARIPVYFVQDYEPWFFPESESAARARVEATYSDYEFLVVKSEWLRDLLRALGREPVKIPLGMNLSIYYPRDVPRRRARVVAMARPRTPRRGFDTLVAALGHLQKSHPSAEIVLFGDDAIDAGRLGFPVQNLGLIADQERLAALYSSADVFVDSSHFQGFGRCALEAMACGAAAVVTDVGGVAEYARNGTTALCVAPREPVALARAIGALLDDAPMRDRIAREGQAAAMRFCHRKEARSTATFLTELRAAS